ncbi:CHAT domain-containing protein [Qipengyuania sp. MTN3-11]|uniref:CHAT domain-containing protein n=1 Tax=Qipengyuania sp. MTN3-11 TaxID=3056557 RepID=UPI0036F200A2
MRSNSVRLRAFSLLLPTTFAVIALPAKAQPVDYRDSFPVGSNGLCEAQIQAPREGGNLFDRRYSVICRDAAAPIGTLSVERESDLQARLQPLGDCIEQQDVEMPTGLAEGRAFLCSDGETGIRRIVLTGMQGARRIIAETIVAYRDAARIGLASLVANEVVEGEIEIPLTQASDARAFARAQAQSIDANAALGEAYRRSNMGNFAEAAEFFAQSAAALTGDGAIEAQLNEALQQSNLGNFGTAEDIFNAQRGAASADPVLARLLRNYEAIHFLNVGDSTGALVIIDRPLVRQAVRDQLAELVIGDDLARRLSAEQGGLFSSAEELTPLERAELLDGQARYIRATALRIEGRDAEAAAALQDADAALSAVRGGRIVSILWLRAQVLGELAENRERMGQIVEAEALHREAIALLEQNYPGSPALLSARAQLAGLFLRTGRTAEARATYRELVDKAEGTPSPSLRALMRPYFRLLSQDESDPQGAAAEMFLASQLLLRPGLAQTQAVLARELSAGDDEAAQLFRQATNLARAVERVRNGLAQIEGREAESPEMASRIAARKAELEALGTRQLAMQQQLAEYPRYRVISDGRMTLEAMRETLREGEGYFKLVALDDALFGIYVDAEAATAYAIEGSADDLEERVETIRSSIAIVENGETVTYPFDMATARELYLTLFKPIDAQLRNLGHLVFEPDGAMLKLPANLLVMNDESVARYRARVDDAAGDPYDFTGTEWLGRKMRVSTSVSPTSFRDVRRAPRSSAANAYLGFGENEPVGPVATIGSGTRSALAGGENCLWAPAIWNDPIDATELRVAADVLGRGRPRVVTGGAFTDLAVKQMEDLGDYRIIHFATHGLVTAPQEGCPPRPALLTSFADDGAVAAAESDGLLSFAEIYDLKLDADLVILSACDTAGTATVGATREAGVASGGDFALDGLVRAFVGAGGRSVVASHWPVPNDFDATQMLITGIFTLGNGNSTGEALRLSQEILMDAPETSHPFYWSAFAIVGDGEIAVTRASQAERAEQIAAR